MRNLFAITAVVVALSSGSAALAVEQDPSQMGEEASLQGLIAECEKQAIEIGVEDKESFVNDCVNEKLGNADTNKS